MASKAVHGGEVLKKEGPDTYWKTRAELAQAQDSCRLGTLKLVREDPPNDWSDLVQGGPDALIDRNTTQALLSDQSLEDQVFVGSTGDGSELATARRPTPSWAGR